MKKIRHLIAADRDAGYVVYGVPEYFEGLKNLCTSHYQACFIDFGIKDNRGLELIMQAVKCGCRTPLVLLVQDENPVIDSRALELGAVSFCLERENSMAALKKCIRYAVALNNNFQKIKWLNDEMEQRIVSRTKELFISCKTMEQSNSKLRNEIAKMERAEAEILNNLSREHELNELKSRFVTMASHEFRSPLSTILSSVSLIEQYIGSPEHEKNMVKHVYRIKFSVDELIRALNELLLIENMDEKAIESKKEIIDLYSFTKEIICEMQECTKRGQKILYYRSEQGAKKVLLDRNLLKSVLLTLISNSIKYSGENTNILITTKIKTSEITITVKDEGIGIPVEDQRHLFKKFFRGANAMNIQGKGLGLNLIKNYLLMMNGSIEFESRENIGSRFTVKFSLEKPQHSQPELKL